MTGWAAFWLFMALAFWCSHKITRDDRAHAHEERMECLRRAKD